MGSSQRDSFGSRFAFIMAMAGSAIGLGNVWRFPYLAGENGGAAFFFIYVLSCVIVSLPIFCCESIIGRRARLSSYGAVKRIAPGSRLNCFGLLPLFTSIIISSFYCVVGGWSLDYFVRACAGNLYVGTGEEASSLFNSLSAGVAEPLIFFLLFIGASAVVVFKGISGGIEKFSKYATPVLGILIVVVAVYSMCLPGAEKGIDYLLKPDWSGVTVATVANAMGQSFFSMSLGAGVILVYSSFMKKSDNILLSGAVTTFFDTLFAIIAGLAVMPAVFSAGLEPMAGPSLVFETLPLVFTRMTSEAPVIGNIITVVFFATIVIAAITSSISMLEVGIEQLTDHFGLTRLKATSLFLSVTLPLGVLCCLSFGVLSDVNIFGHNIFGFCDIISSNFLMTITALFFSVFVGWKMKREEVWDEFTNGGTLKFPCKIFTPLYLLIKWGIPVLIAVIIVTSLLA